MAVNWRRSYNMRNQDILTCDICMEAYNEAARQPKFLTCHHSFCESCLLQVAHDQENIECPACRKVTSLSDTGVSGLQTNFYISFMRDTIKKLGEPRSSGCAKHFNQPLSFFCTKCGITICRDCTVLDHKEKDSHEIQDIGTAEAEQRSSLADDTAQGKGFLETVEAGEMVQLEAERENLTVAKEMVLKDIGAAFEKFAKLIEVRKLQLSKEVTDLYNHKQEAIIGRCEEVGACVKELSGTLSQASRVSARGPLTDVVPIRNKIRAEVRRLEAVNGDTRVGANLLAFDAKRGESSFQVAVSQLGIISSEECLPVRVDVETQCLTAGLPCLAEMKVYGYDKKQLVDIPIDVVVYDQTGAQIESLVSSDADKLYTVLFTPQMRGEYKLMPTFRGHPIPGAEVALESASNDPVARFGEFGEGFGNYRCPRAIVLDNDGGLFIADTGNHMIQKLDRDGNFTSQFKIDGGVADCSTCDLALNISQDCLVCTETIVGSSVNPTMGNTVAMYSTDGTLIKKFANKSMKCALCIAANSHGEIIISDYIVHGLFIYDHEGNFLRQVGPSSHFNHPAFICIGKDDTIIVSDTNNDTVQVFDREGKFKNQFGKSGSGKGELRQPFGVATDGENILVVDSGNKRVQIFKMDGTFVSLIESTNDPLDQPRGMAVTDNGHFFVADRDNHCIKKYKYK